jgi:hypothetical protein
VDRSRLVIVVGGGIVALGVIAWISETAPFKRWWNPEKFWREESASWATTVNGHKRDLRQCASDFELASSAEGKQSFMIQHKLNGGEADKGVVAYQKDLAMRMYICDAFIKSLDWAEGKLSNAREKEREARSR